MWKQYELHFKEEKNRDQAIKQITEQMKTGEYYFNRYTGPKSCFLKLGVIRDIDVEFDLDEKPEIRETSPDLMVVGDVIVDDLKALATTVSVNVFKLTKHDLPAIQLFIHFMLNQLGYNYNEEIAVYSRLINNIVTPWLE